MNVLVTGGAGYIGSHALKALRARGYAAIALDDLSTGHREVASRVEGVSLVEARVQDRPVVEALLKQERIEAVLHFAASCYVGESVREPARYYENNVVGTLRLAEACVAAGVRSLVLSSTCATYGEPAVLPIDESAPQQPVNPYGRSKLMAERILSDVAAANPGFRPIFLRYFNAAGCDPDGDLGEDHDPETHLIPNALRAALGVTPGLEIHGGDYPTRDGTCIRDYIHVTDLAEAHLLALDHAAAGGAESAFNLGTGRGFTVREVADMARKVSGVDFPVAMKPRRDGDPPSLVAAAGRATAVLGWRPRFTDLETIVATAWRWMAANPGGYRDRPGRGASEPDATR